MVRANVVLGEPLAFSIFDASGRLLLRQGVVVTMPDQIERLIARGAMIEEEYTRPESTPTAPRPPVPAAATPAFERVGGLILNLKHVVTTALKTPEQIDVAARVGKIAVAIQEICAEDLDSALAAPYLDFQNAYLIVHQIMGAVLTEVIARHKAVAQADRLAMVCAALTRDWGQVPLQAELDQNDGPLPEALKTRLSAHPTQGVELLAQAGVADQVWLEAVGAHHERLDGSGYPNRRRGDEIPLAARILAVADIYSAMAKPRPYRSKAHYPQNALREIYQKKDREIDGELASILIRTLGVLPPGSIVKLKCGEIAVIKRPTAKAEGAEVYSVYGKTGMVLPEPVRRDTSAPEFAIAAMTPFSECRSAAITIKRVWAKGSS